ncbi:MAG: 16S rRNA (cytidine(1402)-2'-O)-methyltransferase [Candidatus Pacebacteria bacterium]|nr:16S rRNA (cytidine(1402)-2'-O)-methyltransferase [Candidatus Paceibacterota bacterium]MBP9866816.1 16S rRNA (cytidine(1402)-2'-O)-methyltransferase [Candidatus Paceibacterota bacterium]
METSYGILYIVPTPIGNLEDITLRAIRILKEVDLVLCEDTSVTQKLFKHYDITTKTSLFYAQTGIKNIEKILNTLSEGKKIALVSDAGTPTISDPGVLLVDRVRKELKDVSVISLPGASALVTALASSGISSASFTFYGFLPHKKGRETLFKIIAENKFTSVFYESVHRIEKTLEALSKILSNTRQIVIARELTKMHEEVIRGTSEEISQYFKNNKDHIRGEFVVIVEGV